MRASFIRVPLAALGAVPAEEIGGGLVATRVPGENPAAPWCFAICRRCPAPALRARIRARWLAAQGLDFPEAHNWATAQTDGSLAGAPIARRIPAAGADRRRANRG